MTTRPTIKPKLKKDGPDRYVGRFDPTRAQPTGRAITVERDGSEWVRIWDYSPQWFASLAEVRRRVADTNVSRWASRGGRSGEAAKFVAYARRAVPGPYCKGVRGAEIPGFGAIESHSDCCNMIVRKPLPEGVTLLDLYEDWSER